MADKRIVVNLAGIEMAFRLRYSGTEMLFQNYTVEDQLSEKIPEVSVSKEEIRESAAEDHYSPEFAEFCCLRRLAGKKLALFNRALFHGVALIYNGGAYILTAPSGIGKSTQFRNLCQLYGNKFRIICGDKPILRLETDGGITVCPSPWNGKESWGGTEEAPLKGIILLEQSPDNDIRKMTIDQALIPVIQQFLYMTSDEDGVRTMCRIADVILSQISVFSFANRGDLESSILLAALISRLE